MSDLYINKSIYKNTICIFIVLSLDELVINET